MSEHAANASPGGAEFKLDLVALGGRSYAFVLDWHFRFIAAFLWFGGGLWMQPEGFRLYHNPIFHVGSGAFNWIVVPALLIYFLYHPLLEILLQGYTPGKQMVGVQILSKDGKRPSVTALLIRNLLRLIDSLPLFYLLGMIVCLSTKRYQRIGDILAGTVLVYEETAVQQRRKTIANTQGRYHLSMPQRELVAELLDRWRELDPGMRQKLAQELLRKFDQALPPASAQQLDKSLQQRLQHVLK